MMPLLRRYPRKFADLDLFTIPRPGFHSRTHSRTWTHSRTTGAFGGAFTLPGPGPELERWKGREGRQDGTCPNPDGPERVGATLAAPDPQRQKLDAGAEKERGDREFSDRHGVGSPGADIVVTITPGDIAHTGKYPTLGWPDCSSIFPTGQPADNLRGPIFARWAPTMDGLMGNLLSP